MQVKIKDYSDFFNRQYGLWKTYDEIQIKNRKAYIKSRCECGLIKFVGIAELKTKKSTKCCNCAITARLKKNIDFPITQTMMHKIKSNAFNRKLEFDLTKEYLYDLYLNQDKKCIYSGVELFFNSSSAKTDGNASLDRIDSSIGYIKGNVQWVHKKINCIKMNLSHNDFINICCLISQNYQLDKNYNINKYIRSTKYSNKRDLCKCGNQKLKSSKTCKFCQ